MVNVEKESLFSKLTNKRRLLAAHLNDPAAVGFWRMVVDKYAVKAHFICELLQNSDDALATSVRIVLTKDGLYYIHNGEIGFSVTDVDSEGSGTVAGHINAITSIGATTKLEGNKIGKFGIGFKSVFQYTTTPHIEDDTYSFRIDDFIVPIEEPRLGLYRKKGETLFYLPFDRGDDAYNEILCTLKSMSNPLLFLHHVSMFSWETDMGEKMQWEKNIVDAREVKMPRFDVYYEKVKVADEDYRICFWKQLEDSPHRISIVYQGDEKNKISPITETNHNLYCFFSLEETIHSLLFILHAPFLLSENRERIKQAEKWNEQIFDNVYELLSAVPYLLNVLNLNAKSFLDLVPIKKVDYPLFDFGRYKDKLVDGLRNLPVFSTNTEKGYVMSNQVRICENKMVKSLFTEDLMNGLFKGKLLYWPASSFSTAQQTFLIKYAQIGESVSFESILSRLTGEFMSEQSKEWTLSLYDCILSEFEGKIHECEFLKHIPLFLCSDGVYRSICDGENVEQIFISDQTNQFNDIYYVDDELLKHKSAKIILDSLGVDKPSQKTLVERSIILNYLKDNSQPRELNRYVEDIKVLSSYFSSISFIQNEKTAFLERLKDCAFILCTDCEGRQKMVKPTDCYFDSPSLRSFFGEDNIVDYVLSDLVKLLPADSRNSFYFLLTSLGVSFYPKILGVERIPTDFISSKLELKPASLRVYDDGQQTIIDKVIDGFDGFLGNWSEEKSVALFVLLGKMIGECGAYTFGNQLKGEYSYYEKSKTTRTTETIRKTTAYRQLFDTNWLPGVDGCPKSLKEISSSEDLSIRCFSDESFKFTLQFFAIKFVEPNRTLTIEDKRKIALIDRLYNAGFSDTDIENLISGKSEMKPKL